MSDDARQNTPGSEFEALYVLFQKKKKKKKKKTCTRFINNLIKFVLNKKFE